ncbi:MAG: restriction endonuclease subunit S [Acutalibacteraceae bacterium]|nr:restriction endonuclease subunit S [Acutalibacteraceae bacterium]
MITKLKNIGTVITGNTPKTSEEKNYATPDIPFVKPSDLCNETITLIDDTEFHISEYARDKARIVPVNSVFMTCIGIIGKVGINNCECAFNQQINVVVPNTKKCLCEYLAYALVNKKDIIQATANAPVVPILNKTQFENIEIDIPNLEKQKEVVAVLTKIDYLISTRKQQVLKLDELIKSRFIEMFGDPIRNEKEWLRLTLGDICEIGSSKRVFEKDYVPNGIPFFRTKEIVELSKGNKISTELFITKKHFETLKKAYGVPKKNDLLISAVGTIGTIWIVSGDFEFYFKDGNLIQIKSSDSFNSIFMKYLLNELIANYKKEMSTGTAYSALTIAGLKKMLVYDVPLALQNEFATFVEQTDKLKFEAKQSLEKLEMLKKALMQEYFG